MKPSVKMTVTTETPEQIEQEERDTGSEFGKGFLYSLFLFGKHWGEFRKELQSKGDMHLWFNAAADHFYQFEIPERLAGTEIAQRFIEVQKKSLGWRLSIGNKSKPTQEDFEWVFEEIEWTLREIDREFFGVEDVKATWR